MSCVRLEENFNLKLKKIFSNGGSRYELQLCCPVIVNLENDCPRDMVAIKIPNCFVSNGVVYEIDEEYENTKLCLAYTNQTLCNSEDSILIKNENCWFIFIRTDTVLKVNDLCITTLNIPVVPSCLDNSKISSNVAIEDIVTFEYYDVADLSGYYGDSTIEAQLDACIADPKHIKNKDDLQAIKAELEVATIDFDLEKWNPAHPAYPHLLLYCLSN
jgi:hypothetical protein